MRKNQKCGEKSKYADRIPQGNPYKNEDPGIFLTNPKYFGQNAQKVDEKPKNEI